MPQEQAADKALAKVIGAASRHTLDGGRSLLRTAIADDRRALGRLTAGLIVAATALHYVGARAAENSHRP